MLDDKGTDDAECGRKVSSGRKVAGAIKSLVNAKGLSLECMKVLHESMLIPVLMYGSESMVWKKRYRDKMQAVQMDNLRGVLGVRRIDKMRNERIRELCGVEKGVLERISESILRWFGHMERMDESRLVKRVYKGVCEGYRGRGRPKNKWIGSVEFCLEERNLNLILVRARGLVHNRDEWRGIVRGYGCGPRPGDEPLH
jgi:hypothetical protein